MSLIPFRLEEPLHPMLDEHESISIESDGSISALDVPAGSKGCIISCIGDATNTDANKAVAWAYGVVPTWYDAGFIGHPLGDAQYLVLSTVEQMNEIQFNCWENGKADNKLFVSYYY